MLLFTQENPKTFYMLFSRKGAEHEKIYHLLAETIFFSSCPCYDVHYFQLFRTDRNRIWKFKP